MRPLLACLALLLLAPDLRAADQEWHAYFDGLRQRHLFAVAEGVALRELDDASHPPRLRALFLEELGRTYVAHGRVVGPEEQEQLWEQADELITQAAGDPQLAGSRVRLNVQQARLAATRAEFQYWEARIAPADMRLKRDAITALETALERYRDASDELEEVRKTIIRRGAPLESEPRPEELREFRWRTAEELAELLLLRASLEVEVRDRARFLSEAERLTGERLKQAVRENDKRDSEILRASVARLRGETERAVELLKQVDGQPLTGPQQESLTREMVRTALTADRPDEAMRVLTEWTKNRGALSGELAFLRTRAFLAMADLAGSQGKSQLQSEIRQALRTHLDFMREEIGGYWLYRSERLAASAEENATYGARAAGLVTQARAAYGSGDLDRAAALFASAARAVLESTSTPGSPSQRERETAAEMFATAAAVRVRQKKYADAVPLFEAVVKLVPGSSRAADADLVRAWCLGRLYEASPAEGTRSAYRTALEMHGQVFPNSPTAGDAAWMLGRLEESRLQRSLAIPHYRAIPVGHPKRPLAEVAIARCHEGILGFLAEANRSTESWSRAAAHELRTFLADSLRSTDPLTLPEAELALRLARIFVHYRSEYDAADRLLGAVLATGERVKQSDPSAFADPQTWAPLTQNAYRLQILTLAARGELLAAERRIDRLAEEDLSTLLPVLAGLSEAAGRVDDATQQRVAQLQLQAAERLRAQADQFSEAEQRYLERSLGQALVATKNPIAAAKVYEEMLAKTPNDPKLLRKTAGLLLDCGTKECLRKSLGHFRTLERGHKPGSESWIDARYHRVLLLTKLGEDAEAKKLLTVTKVLYPSLGGEAWAARFAKLEADAKT